MFMFVRNALRKRAIASLIEAERDYLQARRRYRRAVAALASNASSPLSEANEVVRDLALARARSTAEELLATHARCESLREPSPLAPALPTTLLPRP